MKTKALVTTVFALLAAASAFAQHIVITPGGSRPTIRGPAQAYTGTAVADTLVAPNDPSRVMAVTITFEPGARTAWHNHPAGQFLIVTSGVGWVQERGGKKREVRPGDVIWTPPGVVHWHGATATNAMTHLAVWDFVGGSGGELMEHVSDEDYLAE
ncbi:MAG: cupin domain-containing protein [Gammaproteobacteria bacterium]